MSDKLPFEDAFKNKINELPTGNEDASWQKMKRLLDEKEKRRPFAWLNIYFIAACILIVAAFGVWLYYNSNNKDLNKSASASGKENLKSIADSNKHQQQGKFLPCKQASSNTKKQLDYNKADSFYKQNKQASVKSEKSEKINAGKGSFKNKNILVKQTLKHDEHIKVSMNNDDDSNSVILNEQFNLNNDKKSKNESQSINQNQSFVQQNNQPNAGLANLNLINDSAKSINKNIVHSAQISKPDSNTVKATKQIKSAKQKQFYVAAGAQLKQQIPLVGEKLLNYSYNSKKSFMGDYIPAPLIQFGKDKRWFVQTEFKYSTPELLKPTVYADKDEVDNNGNIINTKYSLQKTYFNELPLSFNWYIKPNFFAGAGISFNWLHGAVIQQQKTNNIDSGIFTTKNNILLVRFNDSSFKSNNTAIVSQIGYNLKDWSFGLRYKQYFNKYIMYSLPYGGFQGKHKFTMEVNVSYTFYRRGIKL